MDVHKYAQAFDQVERDYEHAVAAFGVPFEASESCPRSRRAEAVSYTHLPLDVDAVLFWVIWDPEKACTEVEDCYFAVALSAQTALRDAIGRASLQRCV